MKKRVIQSQIFWKTPVKKWKGVKSIGSKSVFGYNVQWNFIYQQYIWTVPRCQGALKFHFLNGSYLDECMGLDLFMPVSDALLIKSLLR